VSMAYGGPVKSAFLACDASRTGEHPGIGMNYAPPGNRGQFTPCGLAG
jgi:hypothetical protein